MTALLETKAGLFDFRRPRGRWLHTVVLATSIGVCVGLSACSSDAPDNAARTEPASSARPAVFAVERSRGTATLYSPEGRIPLSGSAEAPVSLQPSGTEPGPAQSSGGGEAALAPPARPAPDRPTPRASEDIASARSGSPAHLGRSSNFVHEWTRQASAILEGKGVSAEGISRRLRLLIGSNFNVPSMAQYALGDEWRTLSGDQRDDYVDLFHAAVLVAHWTGMLGDERIVRVTGANPRADLADGRQAATVRSEVRDGDGVVARVDWLVVGDGGDYRILDVMTSGVSLREESRAEFSRFFRWRGGGIDALLAELRARLDNP